MSKPDLKALSTSAILDSNGKSVPLSGFWQSGPVIFILLRHFACIACRAHAQKVWEDHTRYEAAGARLVFIGNGKPFFIQGFKEDLGLGEAEVYTDPSLQIYRAAGLNRGKIATFGPRALTELMKLKLEGHSAKLKLPGVGDTLQQGGILAVAKGGKVVFHYASKFQGDFPTDQETARMLAAISGRKSSATASL